MLVALTVFPAVTIGALRIVTQPWIVRFEADHGRLPPDRYGLTGDDRERLGLVGLEAIRPGGEGIAVLRRTRLPDGSPAFGARELRHMEDVRRIVGVAFRAHSLLLLALVVLTAALARVPAARTVVPRGLRWGAIGTLVAAAAIGALMAVAWDRFFTGFHELFFEGRTWFFDARDTLPRVYPDAFWMGVGAWIAGIATILAVAVLVAATAWGRRLRPRAEPGAGADGTGDEWSAAA